MTPAGRSEPNRPAAVAERVAVLTAARSATLGAGRLVCVDGPAGSGKTTLAAALASLTGATVVHMDDLYDGWDGLPRLTDQLDSMLRPLASGSPGTYRRYDWELGAYAESVRVAPAPLLVLEGVGSGSLAHADLITTLVWVEAEASLRLARGLERDGVALADRWARWMVDEAAYLCSQRTRERADVVVDGSGLREPVLR